MPSPFENKDHIVGVENVVRDKDLNWNSPHHSLGRGPTQAAPGNHTHTTKDITDYVPGTGGVEPDLSLMAWDYDTNTTMADPGAGKVRADTPQWSPTNNFAISTTTANGQNATADLAALTIGDLIYFQEAIHPANWGTYKVKATPTAHATWFLVPVEVGELHGGALRAVAQEVQARFLEGSGGGTGVTDHGALSGLTPDDDHPQYHNDTRGDARYSRTTHNHADTYDPAGTANTAVSNHVAASDPHTQYVKKAGDQMTGDLRIKTGSDARVLFDSPSGNYAGPQLQTNGVVRWWLYKSTLAEAGSDAGSNLRLSRYGDAGAHLGIPIEINRATGVVTFETQPTVSAGVADIAMASGWAHYGGSFGNCKVTRFGNGVILQGLAKRVSDLTPVVGTYYPVGTVPDGFKPDVIVYDDSYYNGGSTLVRVQIDLAGVVSFSFLNTNTIITNGWCPINTSWRAL